MNLTDKLIALLKRGAPVYGTIQKSFSKNDALEILEECLKESDADYASRSAKRAIKYILEYKKDNAYFILVLDVKDETIKQHLFFNEMIL